MSSQKIKAVTFRPASPHDCSHLVALADMATRRLTSHLWGLAASPGQSPFEIGRNVMRGDASHFTHYSHWRVAERDGEIVGGLNSFVMTAPSGPAPDVVRPLNDLKALAVGTWYIAAAAIFPEHQGSGCGKALLAEAESLARQNGRDRLTLMVGSFNTRAYGLYRQFGMREWERRSFLAFPGSDPEGEWILMVKDLDPA